MQGDISIEKKRKRKVKKLRTTLDFSQEKGSYYFFIGLLIIAIFCSVASGAPRQGFYGILFISIGILVTLFPPAFTTPRWLNIGLVLFLISLASSLLPRSFAGKQSWRTNLESLGLETGNLISPHPAVTIESLIIVGVIIILILCVLGRKISRDSFLKISRLFVIAVAAYSGISIIFYENQWSWRWNPSDDFGFFANRNHMATLMVMGSLVGVGSIFTYIKKKNWTGFLITLLATSIICWAILGYSISRAGMILFISLQIIWFLFVVKKHLNHKLVISFLVLFSLAIILFLISDTRLEDRFNTMLIKNEVNSELINSDKNIDYSTPLGLRKYIHADTYKMIKSEPWTGTGLGTFEFIFPFYKKQCINFKDGLQNADFLHPESNWLDLASQAGILSVSIVLICILLILFKVIIRNRKSRSWLLFLSCVLSIFCILFHGIIDVPGQKIGIVTSGILLIGISFKPDHSKDENLPQKATLIYQILAIGIFSLGLLLVHSQWFNSKSIIFSDSETHIKKIQNLYKLSINAAKEKDTIAQKKYITSAIDLTENVISRSPLDADLHFIKGKLYSFLNGNEEKIKSSFKIESTLDPNWVNLPLRQSEVWLFIDINETRRLWAEALERSDAFEDDTDKSTWYKILTQADRHPIHIRNVYEIIMYKDDPYYINEWMNFLDSKDLRIQMPKILDSTFLTSNLKKDITAHWQRISPKDFEKYLKNLEAD